MTKPFPRPLFIACALFVLLATCLNFLTPVSPGGAVGRLDFHNANPDEHQHLAYVLSVAHGHWPVLSRRSADYESHQSPLFYALCAPFVRGASLATAMHIARGVSTVLVLLTMIAAYFYLRRILPTHPRVVFAATMFVGFLPMNLAQAASVTNDSLLELAAAAMLLISAYLSEDTPSVGARPLRPRLIVALGIVLGLGMWAKTSALALIPPTVLFFAALAYFRKIPVGQAVREACTVLALSLALSAPLWWRNQTVYGDPLAARAFRAYFPGNHVSFSSIPTALKVTFMSFWGFFDAMHLHYPGVVYILMLPVCAIAGIGAVLYVARRRMNIATVQLIALALSTLFFYIVFNTVYFQPQGRYLYPALIPIALCFTMGIRTLVPAAWRLRINALGLGILALLNLLAFAMIVRHFIPHQG